MVIVNSRDRQEYYGFQIIAFLTTTITLKIPISMHLYCCSNTVSFLSNVWAPAATSLSKSMEQIHDRFVRHIFNDAGLAECCHFHTIAQVY